MITAPSRGIRSAPSIRSRKYSRANVSSTALQHGIQRARDALLAREPVRLLVRHASSLRAEGSDSVARVATADLTVIALGRPDASASAYIAEIQRRLAAQERVRFEMHAMGTSLEGSTADILAVVAELHAVPFELGVPRVYTVLKLDERRDKAQTLDDKVTSVRRLLED